MSDPFIPPTFPADSQVQIPCDPDRELGSVLLRQLPIWMAGSGRIAGYQRTETAIVTRILQNYINPARERILGFRETDPTQWPAQSGEAPYWVVQSDRLSPFTDPTVFSAWQTQAIENTPFVVTADLQLSEPGILVSNADNLGFFIPLPPTAISERFWQMGDGPSIYVDPSNTIYLKDLDRTVTNRQAAISNDLGTYSPYTGDSTAINFIDNVPDYAAFDSPILPIQLGYRPVYMKRLADDNVYDYDGQFLRARSWDVVTGAVDLPTGILSPALREGESTQFSYVSSGKQNILNGENVVLFQGDIRFPGTHGVVSGPWLPADSRHPEVTCWGTPSRGFLSLFPPVLRRLRGSEDHAHRIQRLLYTLKVKGLAPTTYGARWILLGVLGQLSPVTMTGTQSATGEVFIPSLQGGDRYNGFFTREDINLNEIREPLVQGTLDTLVSTMPLIKRAAGQSYGGTSVGSPDNTPAYTRFSPFARTSALPLRRKDIPIPVKSDWTLGNPLTTDTSFAVGVEVGGRPVHKTPMWHPNYTVDTESTYVNPGVLGSSETREGFSATASIQVKTPEDAYKRGDSALRGPDRPTPLWQNLTGLSTDRPSWGSPVAEPNPISSNSPLDLDLNITPPVVATATYGSGATVPSVYYTHPLAKDYA